MEEVNHEHGLKSSLRFGLLGYRVWGSLPGKRSEQGLVGKAGVQIVL